jgi:hypothetical protein
MRPKPGNTTCDWLDLVPLGSQPIMPKNLLDTGALACFCHLIWLAFARTNISALIKTFSITWILWSQVELLGPEIYLLHQEQNKTKQSKPIILFAGTLQKNK